MRKVLLATMLAVGVAASARADERADFLQVKAVPLKFAFVSNVDAEKGVFKIIVPVEVTYMVPGEEVEVVEDGMLVKKRRWREETKPEHSEQEFALDRVRVTTAEGKEVPTGDLGSLTGKAVIFVGEEAGVRDFFLKLLRKDTYVVAIRPAK